MTRALDHRRGAVRTAPASERALAAGAYLAGVVELARGPGRARLRRPPRPRAAPARWSGAPALLGELVLALAGLILVSEALGTFGGFGEAELIVAASSSPSAPAWSSPAGSPGRAGPRAGAAGARRSARSRHASLLACRRAGRGMDGADARQPRRGHGSRRHPLVPHAARGEVRPDRLAGRHLLLRPDLLRVVLSRRTPRSCTRCRSWPSGRDIVSPLLNLG